MTPYYIGQHVITDRAAFGQLLLHAARDARIVPGVRRHL